MSRLAELITEHRSDWLTLPDDLERAWVWLEEHGYAVDAPGGYCLTVSEGDDSAIVFIADGTLDGWLEPDESGHADLLPNGDADGSGSIIALWRDGDAVRVVLLGSDGVRGILAQDAQEMLTLLAIGYHELSELTLGAEPEEPVDAGRFRAWLEGTVGVTVPRAWPALSGHRDDFDSWMAAQLGEELRETTLLPPDSSGAQIEGDLGRFMAPLGEADDHSAAQVIASLLDIRMGDTLRSSTKALAKVGLEVDSTRKGVETIWITMSDYPRSAELISGLVEDLAREQVLSFLGEPELAGEKWVRYAVGGRYVHFEFEDRLTIVTLMVDEPSSTWSGVGTPSVVFKSEGT